MCVFTNLFYLLALLCVSPIVLYRYIRYGRYKRGILPKLFGVLPPYSAVHRPVWLHAVSVGEVQLLRTLIKRLELERPDLKLVVSSSTDSGYDVARELYSNHFVFFAPLDFSWAVNKVFDQLNPSLIVLAELELWPNLLHIAEKRNCPTLVVNGRLSAKSFRGYSKLAWLTNPMVRTIDWVGAQNATYQQRFVELGVARDRTTITGSIKFDGAESSRLVPDVEDRRALLRITKEMIVLVAGSTQSPEESIILSAFQSLAFQHPNLRLLLIPRHKERFEDVSKLIESTGFPWVRRSSLTGPVNDPNWKILLVDTMGELRWWWGLADIGFVGGSFGDRGGQNMIEPCAYGVATSFGPNTKNFSDIVSLLREKDACRQFQTVDEIVPWIESMILDSDLRKRMGDAAQSVAQQHRGALERTWQELCQWLPPR